MADDSSVARLRRVLNDAIAQLPGLDDELYDGSYLVGWVLITEFAVPDGGRTLASYCGADGGESDVLPWQAKGYLHEALDRGLFEPVTFVVEVDEDEDEDDDE